MENIRQPILVFGATGRQGGAVANALLKAKFPVRAFVRDPARIEATALGAAGAELVSGSFEDTCTLRSAMKGAYGVFSVLPGNLPHHDEVRIGCAIADLAVEGGVAHFVYSSGASVGEELTGVPRFDAKPRIEAHVRKLRLTATIVRPMIFMEMLMRPGNGLDEGRYAFFLGPDQAMQLIAVEDIGKFVAAIFADKAQFAGKTIKIASDTVTGRDLEALLSEAVGHPIAYQRFTEEFLAANPDLHHMSKSIEQGPLGDHVDLEVMRQINPEIASLRSWLAGSGRTALDQALGRSQG
jgi:uncharacterized protein YbjT (DUF2867 family)